MTHLPTYRRVQHTRLSYSTIEEYTDLVEHEIYHHRYGLQAAARMRFLICSLTDADITNCLSILDLERLYALFKGPSYSRFQNRLSWCYSHNAKQWRTNKVCLLHNRIQTLKAGRIFPKSKGPRFDLKCIPDDRLNNLIQSHKDITLVNAMRDERRRRKLTHQRTTRLPNHQGAAA